MREAQEPAYFQAIASTPFLRHLLVSMFSPSSGWTLPRWHSDLALRITASISSSWPTEGISLDVDGNEFENGCKQGKYWPQSVSMKAERFVAESDESEWWISWKAARQRDQDPELVRDTLAGATHPPTSR